MNKKGKLNSSFFFSSSGTNTRPMTENIESVTSSDSDCEIVGEAKALAFPKVKQLPSHDVPSQEFPLAKQDLAVHKKKVEEVELWLDKAYSNDKLVSILLITGPTGAGKTATLRVLAALKEVQVMEWTTPVDEFRESDDRKHWYSQASKFEEYLMTAGRYCSVLGPSTGKRLILVEDYPNAFIKDPDLLHNIIRKYRLVGRSPLVFISTEVNSGHSITRDLFPEKIVGELKIHHIKFIAINATSMIKAINRIAKLENRDDVSEVIRNAICDESNGDIRYAVLTWQFQTQDQSKVNRRKILPAVSRIKRVKKRKEDKNARSAVTKLGGKDILDGTLPSVGRVLYAKREPVAVSGGSTDNDKRGFLKTNPNDIVNQFVCESYNFINLCQENYISIFSDIDSITRAAEYFSAANTILADYKERDSLQEVGFTIVVRGLMNSSFNPIHKWTPLRKVEWTEISRKATQYVSKMKVKHVATRCPTNALLMDIIPLTKALRDNPYCEFVTLDGPVGGRPDSPLPHITDDDSDMND